MIVHYFKITFRNIWKYRTQSLIGIFGLAFGLACFVPALYWLRYETTYDSFYPDAGHIYRIYSVEKQSGKVNEWVPGILERKLHEHFPATEISTGFIFNAVEYFTEETPYIRLRTVFADSTFLRVFQQEFLCGDARQPLQIDGDIVLTESVAVRLFGDAEKAIGQQMKSKPLPFLPPFRVTAVIKDPPPNTNLSFDVIYLWEGMLNHATNMPEAAQWAFFDKSMYVKFHPHTDIDELAGQLCDFTSRLAFNSNIELRILPIGDVRHLMNSDLPFTLNFIRLFIAAGILLLLSALFNFLNFHLDLFRQRIREFRQRAVIGATNRQLIMQMIFELVCIILLGLMLACCFVVTTRPVFSGLFNITIEMSQLIYLFMVCGICVLALALFVGFILFLRLSRSALRYRAKERPTGQFVWRRLAVTVQLSVSVVFIVAALVVMMQMRFVNRKDLGFDRSGIIQLSGLNFTTGQHVLTALKQAFAAIPQIENFTTTFLEPQHNAHHGLMITEVEWQGKPPHEIPAFQYVPVDSRFAETFGLKMLAGKWWNEGERQKVVLNEEAVRLMKLSEPIGAIISMDPGESNSEGKVPMRNYEVVGVVNDFHTMSLRSRIHPAIFLETGSEYILYIRVVPGQLQEAMQRINAILPDIDVSMADVRLTSLDELYNRLNHSEQVGLKLFSVLATVCLLISLFGIYAVATAATQRRRKEIAIRKVVGAEVSDIVRLFFREHALQVIMAGIVALPIAYYAMFRWLQGYAYRTNIPWWLLIGVLAVIVVVVLLTVLGQVLKAANSNPAEVVKSE